jgi:pyrroline-5-carboxylate reductase
LLRLAGQQAEDSAAMTTAKKLPPILLVGCGKMGGAMLDGWLEQGLDSAVVVEPNAAGAARFAGRATVIPNAESIPAGFAPAALVLAIKPQEAAATLPRYARFAAAGTLVVSIMAGKTIAGMTAGLGGAASAVRAMPNTPAAIRRGFTVACAGPGVSADQRALADTLLAATGEVAWVEEEGLIDPVTAVSGGGPAYVFLLAEVLEAAAREQGLPPDLARRMARATVAGSGALLGASDQDAADLRKAVTSPKGTTERALAVLMAPEAWPALMSRAIAAATERSRELAG